MTQMDNRVACSKCGVKRRVRKAQLQRPNYTGLCWACSAKSKRKISGENHYRWKGGFQYSGGYKVVLINKGSPFYCMSTGNSRILEHRLIMAQYLGRPLKTKEIVHHLNGDKLDNRIENLAITNITEHDKHMLNSLLKERIRYLEKLIDAEMK